MHNIPGAPALVLRLRAFLRKAMLRDARSLVESSQRAILNCEDHALRAAFWTLAAATYHHLNERAKMYAAFSAARGYAFCVNDPDVAAELAACEALPAMAEGDLAGAERLCAAALAANSGGIRARAHQVLAAIAALRLQPALQLEHLESAWAAIAGSVERDQFIAAQLIAASAALAVEQGGSEVAARTFERVRAIDWNLDLAHYRFAVLRSLAWDAALGGDHLTAFRLWRESATYATAPASKLAALAERTFLAAEMGQPTFAREELASALTIAESIDWNDAGAEDLLELLAFAEVASAIDPAEARRYADVYRTARAKYAPSAGACFEASPERAAIECYHAGVIAIRLGDEAEGIALLTRAFDVFAQRGFTRRALQCAIHLAGANAGEAYARYARAHAERFPQSWLARAIDSLPQTAEHACPTA